MERKAFLTNCVESRPLDPKSRKVIPLKRSRKGILKARLSQKDSTLQMSFMLGMSFSLRIRFGGLIIRRVKTILAVCGFAPVELGVPFLQGTDERNLKRWYRANYLCIPPIQGNGLKKPTAFNMEPKWLRLNTVKNYYPSAWRGV
jgi:hypothetical protein